MHAGVSARNRLWSSLSLLKGFLLGCYWVVIGRWSRDGNVGESRFGGESAAKGLTEGFGIAGLVTVVGKLGVVLLDEGCEVLACGGVAREVGLLADEADGFGDSCEAVTRTDLCGREDVRRRFACDDSSEVAVTGDVDGFGASVGKGSARERAGDGVEEGGEFYFSHRVRHSRRTDRLRL